MQKTILAAVVFGCLMLPVSVLALPIELTYSDIEALDTDGNPNTFGFGTQLGGIQTYTNSTESLALATSLIEDYFGASTAVSVFDKIEEDDYTSPLLEAVGYDGSGSTNEEIFLSSTFGGWGVSEAGAPGIDFWMVKSSTEFTLWTYGVTSMNGYCYVASCPI